MKKIIKGKGFILRSFKKTDYKMLAKKINYKDIYRYTLNIPYPYKTSDAIKWVNRIVNQYKKKSPTNFHLAIEIDSEVTGCVSLKKIEYGHKAELGYWLAKQYWHKGIMSEAVAQIISLGFKKFKLKKIFACVIVGNTASLKVLAKNGFKKEGLLIQHVKKDGKLKDEYILSKYKYGNRN